MLFNNLDLILHNRGLDPKLLSQVNVKSKISSRPESGNTTPGRVSENNPKLLTSRKQSCDETVISVKDQEAIPVGKQLE